MSTFIRFLYEFMSVFFGGIWTILVGIYNGIIQMFNISSYIYVIQAYHKDFKTAEWIMVVVAVIILFIVLGLIILLIYFLIRKYIRFRKTLIQQESMLEEVGKLRTQVKKLIKEKDDILAMKVSEMGLKNEEIAGEEGSAEAIESTDSSSTSSEDNTETVEDNKPKTELEKMDLDKVRFSKLHAIDIQYQNYTPKNYNNSFTLEELVEIFRNFAASRLRLYYNTKMMRLFISAMSATRLIILQGISGTGKTSLAYAWGKFIGHDSVIASVQPSWRDRTELFGYFNEFTKKFNETDVLKAMYEANYTDDVYDIVLDEMNIARVEYYFAEMLSILEMPSRDEWIVELVPSAWDTDPLLLKNGKLQIPINMWYIGTINNDDSTFAVTDKVYDRAMPIDINDKGQVFEAPDTDPVMINNSYLEKLFTEAHQKNPMSQDMLNKVEDMDNYVIKHFRIAFGNRIVKQMKDFVSTFVECGGTEVEAVDYYLARKVLRKFEQLNLAYIRDEIDDFIIYLDRMFGKENFLECKEYLGRLKKLV